MGLNFELAPWKNTGGCILKGSSVDEAQLQLDDHATKSQAMMSSPFAKPFADRIGMWTARLGRMQAIFDEWLTCQVKWMYLGPVYGSEEIAKQARPARTTFNHLTLPVPALSYRAHTVYVPSHCSLVGSECIMCTPIAHAYKRHQ